jgi:hypothetical protein
VVASPVKAVVVVKHGNSTKRMTCVLGEDGPITPKVPRFDPPSDPLNLPPCAFTARWLPAAKISVSMEVTYRVVGFIDNVVQFNRTEVVPSGVETWSAVRADAANSKAH